VLCENPVDRGSSGEKRAHRRIDEPFASRIPTDITAHDTQIRTPLNPGRRSGKLSP
jgi:hypothetical protein